MFVMFMRKIMLNQIINLRNKPVKFGDCFSIQALMITYINRYSGHLLKVTYNSLSEIPPL